MKLLEQKKDEAETYHHSKLHEVQESTQMVVILLGLVVAYGIARLPLFEALKQIESPSLVKLLSMKVVVEWNEHASELDSGVAAE